MNGATLILQHTMATLNVFELIQVNYMLGVTFDLDFVEKVTDLTTNTTILWCCT